MSILKCGVAAAVTALALPILLSAQKPAKPPKPGGTVSNPAIAYQAEASRGGFDLMVMDANGQNPTRLVAGGRNTAPSWSPDGDWIAFSRTSVTQPGIYIVRRNGAGLCRVVATSGLIVYSAPTWSPRPAPNGKHKLAYVDVPSGQLRKDVFAVDAECNASAPQNLTNTESSDENWPAWSRNDVLALTVDELGEADRFGNIFTVDVLPDGLGGVVLGTSFNLTGSGPRGGDAWGPTWTQDMTELVVSTSQLELWIISATTAGVPTRLSGDDVPSMRATFSPDFTKLAFSTGGDIYTAAVAGPPWSPIEPTILLTHRRGAAASFPSWRPVQ